MNEGQVVLQDQFHLHLGLEEGLRLEYNSISNSQIWSSLDSINLTLAFRIDEEALTSVSHDKRIRKSDDLFVEPRCVIIYDHIIKNLIRKLEMIRR